MGETVRKVTLLSTSLVHGGAETQVFLLAKKFKERGLDVRVISMIEPQAFVAELREQDIPLTSLGMRRGAPDPRAVFRLGRLLKRSPAQVLHSHMIHANLLARAVRLTCSVPVQISTAHSIDEGANWRYRAYRLSDSLCDLTTNVSQAAMSRYLYIGAVPEGKLRLVPNGLDTQRFAPESAAGKRLRQVLGAAGCFVWLAVGRLDKAKDYPTMLRAFRQLSGTPGILLIAGEGDGLAELQQLARELGIADRVRFLGLRRDIPELMSAADAYVMSSAWEGLPMVLLEASASALPIVATGVGGNREVVCDGESGFIVPPGSPEALAGGMRRMMALTEAERRAMGEAGRAFVRTNYDLEHVADLWQGLYQELWEGRIGGRK
jgi:glycosyltransferase involved in cell wall biosynthesis